MDFTMEFQDWKSNKNLIRKPRINKKELTPIVVSLTDDDYNKSKLSYFHDNDNKEFKKIKNTNKYHRVIIDESESSENEEENSVNDLNNSSLVPDSADEISLTETDTSGSDVNEISNDIKKERKESPLRKNNAKNNTLVMELVQKEIGINNVEQQRAFLNSEIEQVSSQLTKSKLLLNQANINLLPDKGKKLKKSIENDEKILGELTNEIESLLKIVETKRAELETKRDTIPKKSKNVKLSVKTENQSSHPWKGNLEPKPLGEQALATLDEQESLTEERLKNLHESLNDRPKEDTLAEDPRGLKIPLMPHQKHALAWLLWRENQRPRGGILADDMGLGKTLTMISLIIATITKNYEEEDENWDNCSDDEFETRKRKNNYKGGTLVVCPASVLSQWDTEIKKRVRGGMLAVELFHGYKREHVPRRLAKNDIVITTYNLISIEYKRENNRSILYEINWKRIILDEAHVIRNPNSQVSEAICNLKANCRWALTGTPIQNKQLDLYALLKFLKCTPFDDLRIWKRWVDNKNAHGAERLTTVMKTLMLRRTKQELQAQGGLGKLPDKNFEEILIKLDPEEQLIYEKILVYSRTLFAQFLYQRAEKNHLQELYSGKYDAPTFLQKPKQTQFTKVQNQLLARHADVKAHEILALLLRLRQVCCHPPLIEAMLDSEDLKGADVVQVENDVNPDLAPSLETLSLDAENIDPNEIGVDRRVVEDLLTTSNPVFEKTRQSSKIRGVLKTIQEILDKGDKMVVVSQWTSMLEVVQRNLKFIKRATYDILSGNVPVKNRQHVMNSFNKVGSGPNILLLSLTAGGVGLNLIGANHLLLLDVHWNPQLEAQAQDRIYRVGQKKSVYIYKFICQDTIEERIKALQDHKLAMANNVLTGAGTSGAAKLTLDDLKSLFSM